MQKNTATHRHQLRTGIAVIALSSLLAACGGSSSGVDSNTIPLGEQDADNDNIINSLDPDADGDNIDDVNDPFVDLDSDGVDDNTGFTEAVSLAIARIGNNDGENLTAVTVDNPCGSETGTDNNSLTTVWNDNCTIKRSSDGGQFADSFYAAGIQRVLYCLGYGSGDSYINFADGEYGPASEAALITYQQDSGLVADGIVGPMTWQSLQSRVELLQAGVTGVTPDELGFLSGRCAGVTLFYRQTSAGSNDTTILGAWELARNQSNEAQRIPYSIGFPFNRL